MHNSITGGNVRGLKWTRQDRTRVEDMSEKQPPTIDQMLGEIYLLQQKENKMVLDIIQNLAQQLNQAQKMVQEQARKDAKEYEINPKKSKK